MHKRLRRVTGRRKKEAVSAALRRLAREIGPGGKLPTVKDLCRQLGVAKVTLDSVLEALDAEGLIRRRQGSGIYVREQRPSAPRRRSNPAFKHVALLTELNLLNPNTSRFFACLFDRLRQILDDAGQPSRLYMGNHLPGSPLTHDDERALKTFLADADRGLISGVASLWVGLSPDWRPPRGVVWVGERDDCPYSVTSDEGLIRQSARYLIDKGCRRLALLAWHPGCEPGQPTGPLVRIFREEVERAGLEYRPEWVRADLHPNADGVGWSDFREVWTSHRQNKPDGLLIADDQLLRDATRAITELRVRVPEELHIISHANKDLPVTKSPFPLAYIEYDPHAQAAAIAEMLLKLLRKEPVIERHVRLGYRLVVPEVQDHSDQGAHVRT